MTGNILRKLHTALPMATLLTHQPGLTTRLNVSFTNITTAKPPSMNVAEFGMLAERAGYHKKIIIILHGFRLYNVVDL